MLVFFRPISVFETTAVIITSQFTEFSSGSFCQIYRFTDEALIAETMVWPNFFLMNVFFALRGSKRFTIIIIWQFSYHTPYQPGLPYQPETLVSARGPKARGLIRESRADMGVEG